MKGRERVWTSPIKILKWRMHKQTCKLINWLFYNARNNSVYRSSFKTRWFLHAWKEWKGKIYLPERNVSKHFTKWINLVKISIKKSLRHPSRPKNTRVKLVKLHARTPYVSNLNIAAIIEPRSHGRYILLSNNILCKSIKDILSTTSNNIIFCTISIDSSLLNESRLSFPI